MYPPCINPARLAVRDRAAQPGAIRERCAAADALALVGRLCADLEAQWEANHFEHCDRLPEDAPYRAHAAHGCHWEPPASLLEAIRLGLFASRHFDGLEARPLDVGE